MTKVRVVGAWVVLCLTLPAWAAAGGSRQDREDLAAMVDTYLLMQVQERLELSDAQFAKVMPLVRRLQEHRRESMDRRREGIKDLRALLESGEATDASVGPKLQRIREAEQSMCRKIVNDLEALDALLTPLQQAKYRVLEAEVEKRIRRLRHRAGGRGPQFPSADPGPPPSE